MTLVHRVRVEDPRHRLRVRADVGRGDVLLGADLVDDLRREPARHALELAERPLPPVPDPPPPRPPQPPTPPAALPPPPTWQGPCPVGRGIGGGGGGGLWPAREGGVRDAVAG